MAIAGVDELFRSRELTANLVRRDLKVRHRGTFLGMLWSLATPLLLVGLYYFVFKIVFQASPIAGNNRPDGKAVPFAIYFFGGLAIWNLFATSVGASPGAVVGAGYLLNKVYFPRAILPLATVLSALVTFGFEFAVLMLAALIALGLPSFYFLWLPVILAITVVMAFGISLLLSTITVFLRDVAHFVGVLMQLWFWGTPIIYSLQFISKRPKLVTILKLNPMTGIVVSFRNVVLLNRAPGYRLLAYDALMAMALLVVGAWVFNRYQKVFSEIV